MVNIMGKLVYGVGVNDADYTVKPSPNSGRARCPFHRAWENMLSRCYNKGFLIKKQTYIGCTVCEEWLTFSNFKRWMEQQDWQGKHLDKDILFAGNKVYSPETCVFVSPSVNKFLPDRAASRGAFPIGVDFDSRINKFRARCGNPITTNDEYLGYFNCPEDAHKAWKKRKHELACQLADLQTDERVAEALRARYA